MKSRQLVKGRKGRNKVKPQVPDTEVCRVSATEEEMLCGVVHLAIIVRAGGRSGGIKDVLDDGLVGGAFGLLTEHCT